MFSHMFTEMATFSTTTLRASSNAVTFEIMKTPCVLNEPVIVSYQWRLVRLSNKRQIGEVRTGKTELPSNTSNKLQNED